MRAGVVMPRAVLVLLLVGLGPPGPVDSFSASLERGGPALVRMLREVCVMWREVSESHCAKGCALTNAIALGSHLPSSMSCASVGCPKTEMMRRRTAAPTLLALRGGYDDDDAAEAAEAASGFCRTPDAGGRPPRGAADERRDSQRQRTDSHHPTGVGIVGDGKKRVFVRRSDDGGGEPGSSVGRGQGAHSAVDDINDAFDSEFRQRARSRPGIAAGGGDTPQGNSTSAREGRSEHVPGTGAGALSQRSQAGGGDGMGNAFRLDKMRELLEAGKVDEVELMRLFHTP
jgi:hypothetical protein